MSISAGGTCCPGYTNTNPPTASLTLESNTICAGECANVVNGTAGNVNSWSWSLPGSNTPTLTNQNPGSICYDAPGTYAITLTATNAFGSSVASASIVVGDCVIPGCMYPQATNYNPQATVDNQTCVFNCDSSCTGDLDLNGIVGVSDLLIFISVFGNTCPN